jgi:hypothetical protein
MVCPWCKSVDQPVNLLKKHIKYCESAPRPRGKVGKAREEKCTEIEIILGIKPPSRRT